MKNATIFSKLLIILLLTSLFIISSYASEPTPASDVFNGGRGIRFNDNWKFHLGEVTGANNSAFNDAAWRQLSLPHDWSIEFPFNKSSAAGGGGGYLDGGIGWYRKSFALPQYYSGKRITIQFEGVYMNSTVWINGHLLGTRPYGYSTFEYDLTPYINTGTSPNVIAVKADNTQPNSRWYSGSGIYRNVWITVTDQVHVAYCGTFVTTSSVSTTAADITATSKIQNHSTNAKTVSVITSIYDQSWNLLTTNVSAPIALVAGKDSSYVYNYKVTNPYLWSLSNPYLYKIKTQIVDNNTILDNFTTTFGIRTITLNPNTGFWLNNTNIKLHGVCMHHDLGSLGAAQNYRALERQVEVLKSFGCNAIRTSHNPPTPELLEICDRLGLIVMDESFDCWEWGKNTNDYGKYFDIWAQQDVQDWIRRDRNHPSVVMWSIGNEIPQQGDTSGLRIAQNLIKWVRTDDATRPLTQALNSQWLLGPLLDIVGYNYASGGSYDTDHTKNPNWVIMGSETSSAVRTRGVYHLPTTQNILTATDMQCSNYDNSVVGWGHSAEDAWEFDRARPFVAGQFIWTGFDYIGEPTPYGWPAKSSYFGVVDMCGFPKDIYYFYQSQWTSKPMVHLLPHWNWESNSTIPVWAYSNCDSVSLFVNGTKISTQNKKNAKPYHVEWNIPFVAGKVIAYAYKNGLVVATDSITTAGNATKIELKTDRDIIQADSMDQAFIETNILDVNGTLIPDAGNQVSYSLSGPGKIVGLDNGNPLSIESFKGSTRQVYNGKGLAIVQSTGAEGTITVTATTPSVMTNLAWQKPSNADSEDIYMLTNVALGKTATADTYETNNPPASGNDGYMSSRWCASNGSAGHWWKVDLGTLKSIIGSEITWEHNNAYQYKIETSADNSVWNLALDKTSNTISSQIMSDNFTANCRYVRITVTGGVSNSWASFFEFKLFDGSYSISDQKKVARNGNDGNIGSYWSAADGNAGHSWGVNLGSTYNINKTQIAWLNSVNAYKYKIEASTDSIGWILAVDQTGNAKNLQNQTDSFNVVAARYVRVTITGGTSAVNKAGFYEFRVYDGSATTINQASVTINCIKALCVNCLIDSTTTKPWVNMNETGWQQTEKALMVRGGSVSFSTLSSDSTAWQWTGPNGFTATTARIHLQNVQLTDSGTYVATHKNSVIPFKLVVSNNTGLNDNTESNLFLYPNPSNDGVLNVVNCKNRTISVYNLEGKNVYNYFISSDSQVINLSFLSKGVFIAKLKSENSIDYKKIILSN
ncbi:MAG: glycoside hydrolase family 2 TIM barrel-domain containing protein [Paludibacter sp.]|nr:glycoside hydrolase family 2 TIM barrel-domain containing protein [Paludibacter sp.]